MMQVGKYIETLKIQVSLEYQLMLSERRQIINGIAVPVANQNNTYGARINCKMSKWADFEYKYKRLGFKNQVNDRISQPPSQQLHLLNMNFILLKTPM